MSARDRLLPWSGLLLGAVGWAMSGQWGAARVTDACLQAWTLDTALIGIVGLLLAAVGAGLSLAADRAAQAATAHFVARLSIAAAAMFALAILFHAAATVMIPRCFS